MITMIQVETVDVSTGDRLVLSSCTAVALGKSDRHIVQETARQPPTVAHYTYTTVYSTADSGK